MVVVDASAVVEVLLPGAVSAQLERALHEPGETLHAPHLIDAEVAHALRGLLLRGAISERTAALALRAALGMDLVRYPHGDLLPRAWELRHNATAYDAMYLALAELLDAPLVTRDEKLRGVPGSRARVQVV